jgi:hypothetical protein
MNRPGRHDAHGHRTSGPRARTELVGELLAIARQALELQPDADAAIRACGAPGGAADEVAGQLGELLRGYSRLHHAAEAVDPGRDPELTESCRELLELLSYHLHMLRDAGDLVFSGRDVPGNERFRRELAAGLGPRARQLAHLRERLAAEP